MPETTDSVVPGTSRILGLGAYRPDRVLTNDELAHRLDTSDEWIRSRVGIRERRIAAPGEGVVDMATAAGAEALRASGVTPDRIDLVIVATCSGESPMPAHAPQVAHALGVSAPGAFDLNAACAGFCYALGAADALVRGGAATHVLVVGAEKMSQWVDPQDRNTAVIFADGAGAAVVGPDRSQHHRADGSRGHGMGIGPVAWGSVGGEAARLTIPSRTSFLQQDGQAVFRWATTAIAPIALEACRRAAIEPNELAAVVPHQANLRIIRAIARSIGAAHAVVAEDITRSGNTSAASIPLAMVALREQGLVTSGAPTLLVGFGAGLAYASQVVAMP